MRTGNKQAILEVSVVKLIEVLEEIDVFASNAKLNEESIDDGDGGRIML